MKIHVLAPQHVLPVAGMSSCAFGQKSRRFGPMMKLFGYEPILYAVGHPDNPEGWSETVSVVEPDELTAMLGFDPLRPGSAFVGNAANIGSAWYRLFNQRLAAMLEERVQGDDIVALTFGPAHKQAITNEPGFGFAPSSRLLERHAVETGIGYPNAFTGYRIYESQAYKNWYVGKEQRNPWLSEWVVPNYFDVADWPLRPTDLSTGYVLYFGRIDACKGLHEVTAMAKARPDLEFVLCGQGDPTPFLQTPNVRYQEPVHGAARAALMHGARCLAMPTVYLEPFGGVSIEAMLTGTPVITQDHSVFTETIPAHLRCRTLGEWLRAIDAAADESPDAMRREAIGKYSLTAVGAQYDRIFQSLPAMRRDGFYSMRTP